MSWGNMTNTKILRNDIVEISGESYCVDEFVFQNGNIVGIRLTRIGKLVSEK